MIRRKKGYLLVEVLVSLSILAIGLLSINRSFSISTWANIYNQDYRIATLLAQEKLSEVESNPNLSFDTTRGGFGEGYAAYSWQLEISPAKDKLAKVILTIFWERRSKDYQLKVRTLVPVSSTTEG